MSFRQKLVDWLFERKSQGFPPWTSQGPWPSSVISSYGGNQGAMQLATVYGCVRVRGQTLGSLPFHVYREDKNGERTKAVDHWLYPLLHDSPNAYQTALEFRECMERSFCLFGNAYAEISKSDTLLDSRRPQLGNRVLALNFLHPESIYPRWDYKTKSLVYQYSYLGETATYRADQILHVKNFSSNGLWGDSPIRNFAINHAVEAQNYGRNFLQSLGRPSGVIEMPGARPANEEAANKMRADWQAIHGGTENAGKTAVLWNGAKYAPIFIPPDEAQYIETRNFSIEEIAGGIFGVPLNLIGHTDKTATYASAEHFDIAFVKHTVRPQCVRYEQAINKSLLANEPGVYCEHDLDGMLRGDSAAQAAFYATVRSNAGMTSNEFRRLMNWPRSDEDGADDLMQQGAMVPLKNAGKTPQPGSGAVGDTPGASPTPTVKPVADATLPGKDHYTVINMPEQRSADIKVMPEIHIFEKDSARKVTKKGTATRATDGTISFVMEEEHGAEHQIS